MTTQTKTKTVPPAAAVVADAHWAAKMARLRDRALPEAVLRICDDQAAKDALATAEYAQRQAQRADEARSDTESRTVLAQAATAVDDARRAVDEATIELRFRALPRPQFEALVEAHPPTEKQATEDGALWNSDTLIPALISAASVDGMPLEDAQHFLDTWASAEARALYEAAMSVQQEDRMDLGKG